MPAGSGLGGVGLATLGPLYLGLTPRACVRSAFKESPMSRTKRHVLALCLLSAAAAVGTALVSANARAAPHRTPLASALKSLAPKRGMKKLFARPSGVFMVPPSTVSIDHRGELFIRRGYGDNKKISVDALMAVLHPGEMGRVLERHGVASAAKIDAAHRATQLDSTLAQLGTSLDAAKKQRLLERNVRLASTQLGRSTLARVTVGETTRKRTLKVLELSSSGALVMYRVEDIQVGEGPASEKVPVDLATAQREFPGLDLAATLAEKLSR